MLRVTEVVRRTARGAVVPIDTITLDRHSRARRRIAMRTDGGREFLLDLQEVTYLAEGDALVAEGQHIVVRAMLEPLMEVRAPSLVELARIAWHLGNRHTPAEITPDAIFVLPDHVLAAMIEGLGGTVRQVVRAFEPEGGAYGGHGTLATSHHSHEGHGHGAHHGSGEAGHHQAHD
ncbi:MAG: urease accessory protein UreE [Hyphomicrobium sp.]|jgi:urease accessory protein